MQLVCRLLLAFEGQGDFRLRLLQLQLLLEGHQLFHFLVHHILHEVLKVVGVLDRVAVVLGLGNEGGHGLVEGLADLQDILVLLIVDHETVVFGDKALHDLQRVEAEVSD